MANLRIQGDTSGYIDIAAPAVSDGRTIDLGQLPQLNQANTFTNTQTIQGSTVRHIINDGAGKGIAIGLWDTVNNRIETSGADTLFAQYGAYSYVFSNQSYGKNILELTENGHVLKPNQPSFHAYLTSNWTHPSGVQLLGGTWAASENVGGHYDATTRRFTAPVSGTYAFNCITATLGGQGYFNYLSAELWVNGTRRRIGYWGGGGQSYGGTTGTYVTYLNAGDYAQMGCEADKTFIMQSNSAGNSSTQFSGYLIG